MLNIVKIRAHERGFLFKNREYVRALGPGWRDGFSRAVLRGWCVRPWGCADDPRPEWIAGAVRAGLGDTPCGVLRWACGLGAVCPVSALCYAAQTGDVDLLGWLEGRACHFGEAGGATSGALRWAKYSVT